MKHIKDRLYEQKQIALAKAILEARGYLVTKDTNLNESVDAANLESEIKNAVREVMTSESFGFPEDEVEEYTRVVIREEDGFTVVEVRAEVSYDGLMEMSDVLNKIVKKYDKDAYFDAVTSGIIEAYLNI